MHESIIAAALSGLDHDSLMAFQQLVNEGPIENLCPVTDVDGDRLIVGQIYQKANGKKFRVTEYRFGGGNFMDTYYWVWGINDDLKDDRITVDVCHTKSGATYPSGLSKAFKLEELPEGDRLAILGDRLQRAKKGVEET